MFIAIQSKVFLKSEEVRCKAVPISHHRGLCTVPQSFSPYIKWGPHRSGASRMATITSVPLIAIIDDNDVSEMQLTHMPDSFRAGKSVNIGLYGGSGPGSIILFLAVGIF